MIGFTVLEASHTQTCLDTFDSVDDFPFEYPSGINHIGYYTSKSQFECAMVTPTVPFPSHSCIYFVLVFLNVFRVELWRVLLYLEILTKRVFMTLK